MIGQEKITWNKDGKEMVLIPAGSFEMGDHLDGMSNAPVHTATLGASRLSDCSPDLGTEKSAS